MGKEPDSNGRKVNRKLRVARMRQFLTVEAAAERIGVSPTTYTRWEQGYQKPHLVTLGRLCDAFRASPVELGFGSLVGQNETSKDRSESYSLNETRQSSMNPAFYVLSDTLQRVFDDFHVDFSIVVGLSDENGQYVVSLATPLPENLMRQIRGTLLRRGHRVVFRQPRVGTLG